MGDGTKGLQLSAELAQAHAKQSAFSPRGPGALRFRPSIPRLGKDVWHKSYGKANIPGESTQSSRVARESGRVSPVAVRPFELKI